MKRVVILGCTGSIGCSALAAARTLNLDITIVGLSAHSQSETLLSLAREFSVQAVCLTGSPLTPQTGIDCYSGSDGLAQMLKALDGDIALNGISGFAGLWASLVALESGWDLALANKESVVCAGPLLFDTARRYGRTITPVDSEHSAIAHLLAGHRPERISSVILTASGGPFKDLPTDRFATLTASDALKHPTWQMGSKITIDSATMANKALEVIEAAHLFGVTGEQIEVVVHPQSIVHSMVRTTDGAVYAQLSKPDMTLAIINAISEANVALVEPLDFTSLSLSFEAPDLERFPLLGLAYEILRRNDASAIAFNAADEVAVAAFLGGRITYPRMIEIVIQSVDRPWGDRPTTFEKIVKIDRKARAVAESLL